jgi:Flp pilus assembly protein TadG
LRRLLDASGAAAVELGLATPVLLVFLFGTYDFGRLVYSTQSIAAATRVGAQYARNTQTCQDGIQPLNTPQIDTACKNGTLGATQNAAPFTQALVDGSNFTMTLTCYCAAPDGSGRLAFTLTPTTPAGTCGNYSCASNGLGQNAMFVTVTASQPRPEPLFSWVGLPATLTARTELRLQ